MQSRERDQVHCQFPQIAIQLAREPQTRANAAHDLSNNPVQVVEFWVRFFQVLGANVVERFIVHADRHVAVFGQLMNGKHRIVWFDYGFGDERTRHHREGRQHAVRLFFAKLGE